MTRQFRDHFSDAAREYGAFRPHYPQALFEALAERVRRHNVAWDCATGTGQAAVDLARYFRQVVANDASVAQLAHAAEHSRVRYVRALAESAPLRTGSVDLITVAQGLHWLDLDAFFEEACRILASGGLLAAWCYGLLEVEPTVDGVLRRFYADTLAEYWPSRRAMVEDEYRSIPFPFAECELPPMEMRADWTLTALAGYMRTWSAVLRYRAETGRDPVDELLPALRDRWGDAQRVREVRWRLTVRAGYVRDRSPGSAGG